jgi:hypothetical protein
MPGFIEILDEVQHIRMNDKKSGVTSFFNKSSLIIQKDKSNVFFLKNESYIKYYNFDDIIAPIDLNFNNIDQLIEYILRITSGKSTGEIISNIVNDEITNSEISLDIDFLEDMNEDNLATETINTSNHYVAGDLDIDSNPMTDDVFLGNIRHFRNYVHMNLSDYIPNAFASQIIRQTKEFVKVPSSKTNITLVSGRMLVNGETDESDTTNFLHDITTHHVTCKIGLFTYEELFSKNGIYFEFYSDGTGKYFALTLVIDGFPIRVNQIEWNLDKLDGSGYSGFTLNPETDHNKLLTFVFRLGTLPGTTMQAGILHKGKVIMVHDFDTDNLYNTETATPVKIYPIFTKLPIRWDIHQLNMDGSATKKSPYYMVQSTAVLNSFKNNNNKIIKEMSAMCPKEHEFKDINHNAKKDMLFDIRLNSSFTRSKVQLSKINILNIESYGRWKLVKNGTIVKIPDNTLNTEVPISEDTSTSHVTIMDLEPEYDTYGKVDILSLPTSYFTDNSGTEPVEDNSKFINYLTVAAGTGTVIASGYLKGGLSEIDLTESNAFLYSNVNGVSDRYSFVVEYLTDNVTCQCSLVWKEIE